MVRKIIANTCVRGGGEDNTTRGERVLVEFLTFSSEISDIPLIKSKHYYSRLRQMRQTIMGKITQKMELQWNWLTPIINNVPDSAPLF